MVVSGDYPPRVVPAETRSVHPQSLSSVHMHRCIWVTYCGSCRPTFLYSTSFSLYAICKIHSWTILTVCLFFMIFVCWFGAQVWFFKYVHNPPSLTLASMFNASKPTICFIWCWWSFSLRSWCVRRAGPIFSKVLLTRRSIGHWSYVCVCVCVCDTQGKSLR